MKRALLATLWIGLVAAAVAIGLQLSGLLLRPNRAIAHYLGIFPNEQAGFGDLLFLLFLGFFVAWVMMLVGGLWRRLAIFVLLLGELIGAAWLLDHFAVNFPPLPAIIVVVLATGLALGAGLTKSARQRRASLALLRPHLGPATQAHIARGEPLDLTQPLMREASFIFCQIGNEVDLLEELAPAECAALTREFIEFARSHFLAAGGYLHAADGEGVRVLFGFPEKNDRHAVEAAGAALDFAGKFRAAASAKPGTLGKIDLRIGISSGPVVATARGDLPEGELVLAGEPLDIARRLAPVNQIYGSRILIGPRTFAAAGKEILARPLDFLRSAEAHDRIEIYELLALAEKATAEEIARRDQFWTGVVYFRERRWNEALAEFSRAQSNNGDSDLPLQWYLRQLEPLCLRVASEPASVTEPFSPVR